MIMPKRHDLLFALLGRTVRTRLLTLFVEQADRRWFIAEAAHAVGVDPAAAQRQLRQLEALGLLQSSSRGYRKYYHVRHDSPALKPLQQLFRVKGQETEQDK